MILSYALCTDEQGGAPRGDVTHNPNVPCATPLVLPEYPSIPIASPSCGTAFPKMQHLINVILLCQKQNVLSRCASLFNYIFLICSEWKLFFKTERIKLSLQKC